MNAISDVSDYIKEKNDIMKQNHTFFFLQTLKNIGFHTLQNIFDALLNEQACFYRIYMKLLGIKHVQSLRKLCIYFFAFGMMNYARMTLVYLS